MVSDVRIENNKEKSPEVSQGCLSRCLYITMGRKCPSSETNFKHNPYSTVQ